MMEITTRRPKFMIPNLPCILLLTTLILSVSGCYGTIHIKDEKPVEAGALDLTSVERGRTVYEESCEACHGADGRGDGPRAGRYNPGPPDLMKSGLHITSTGLESIIDYPNYSAGAIKRRIRHGAEDMPEFKNRFTEEEIRDIIRFLRHLELNSEK